MASHLTTLQDQSLPDAQPLTSLIALRARLDHALVVQWDQKTEVDELRQRSAMTLALWYQQSVLRGGNRWSEWEQRLARLEQTVRRREKARVLQEGIS